MSDSNRGERAQDLIATGLCAIALLGTVIIAYAIGNTLGVGSGRNQVSSREHYENTKQDYLRTCAGREGPAAIECVTEAIEAAQSQSDSRQDLYAQQDMAKWAFWLFMLTCASVGITAVGVWFVKRTLDATLEAVEDTGKGTKAMVRQNEIAEAGQRPWLRYELLSLGPIERTERGKFRVPYRARVSNTGSMPALIVCDTIGREKKDTEGKIAFAAFTSEAYRFARFRTQAIPPQSEEIFAASAMIEIADIGRDGCLPDRTVPQLWAGVAYQRPAHKGEAFFTLQIISLPGDKIRNGDGKATFDISHLVMKTLMS